MILFPGNNYLSFGMIIVLFLVSVVFIQINEMKTNEYKKYEKEYELVCTEQQEQNTKEIEGVSK